MQIDTWPISRLVPYARNPRRNAAAVDAVAASIREFGWRQPIVVDEAGTIICGHTRYLAALKLGLTEVPVHVAVGLTEQQVKALRLVDNRTAEFAEWDGELLAGELADLGDLKLDAWSFDALLAEIEADTGATGPARDVDPLTDQAEELNATWGVRPGDLWRLGDHRLLCGDATKAEDVQRLVGDGVPMLMVTDPPYGVEYNPSWRARAGVNLNPGKLGEVPGDDRADWTEAWRLFPGDVAYVYHAGVWTSTVQASLEVCGFQIRAQIIWAKDRLALGRGDYHWQHEPCWYAVREGKQGHRTDDRSQTSLWTIPARDDSGHGHGTQKPLECMARPIRNHDCAAVYDPFVGSGTTLIACENLGRQGFALEILPAYCAVTLDRFSRAFPGVPVERVP